MLPTAPLRPTIAALAELYRLPPWDSVPAAVWLEAQILQESSGNPAARRYEPALDIVPDADRPRVDDGTGEDDASWGLMQVLGWNVRAQVGVAPGTPMSFALMADPAAGLVFGLRHLVRECLVPVGQDVARALARYNGGPGGTSMVNDPKTGALVLRRQDYVDAVKRHIPAVLADIHVGEDR